MSPLDSSALDYQAFLTIILRSFCRGSALVVLMSVQTELRQRILYTIGHRPAAWCVCTQLAVPTNRDAPPCRRSSVASPATVSSSRSTELHESRHFFISRGKSARDSRGSARTAARTETQRAAQQATTPMAARAHGAGSGARCTLPEARRYCSRHAGGPDQVAKPGE